MQLIDEKGKVLGIINIVDLTVLLFIISTVSGFAWLVYTGELFRDHNPARKIYTYANVTAIITNQNIAAVQMLQQAIIKNKNTSVTPPIPLQINNTFTEETNTLIKKALLEKQNDIAKIKIINITQITLKIGHVEVTKKEPHYDILINVQVPVKVDWYTKVPYLYHPSLHGEIQDLPVLKESEMLLATDNLTFKIFITNIT